MRPEKSDLLIAFKVTSLTEEMTVTEKRIAATLLDHYNRKTGQCDPGRTSLATLLAIDRRTVSRAMRSLEKSGYFRTDRHGGKFHRNSYQPVWARFRAWEKGWAEKRKRLKQSRLNGSEVSPLQGHHGHLGDDGSATQTSSSNRSHSTCEKRNDETFSQQAPVKGLSREDSHTPAYSNQHGQFNGKQSFSEVARIAAERRWNADLTRHLATAPDMHAVALEAIDPALSAAATEAEMKHRGSGIIFLLRELDSRFPSIIPTKPRS